MENEKATKKVSGNRIVETVREGAIGANIRVGQSSNGNLVHYFSISRAWKRQGTDKWFYSDRFYPRHAELLTKVAAEAAERCDQLDKDLDAEHAPAEEAA